jgi:AmmeMemoRadiSam system protein A
MAQNYMDKFGIKCPVVSCEDREVLSRIARESLIFGDTYGVQKILDGTVLNPWLQSSIPSFVSIYRHDGSECGCMGSTSTSMSVAQGVSENAYRAAFHDSRFVPMCGNQIEDVRIEIALLGSPQLLNGKDEEEIRCQLKPNQDGLYLQSGSHKSFLLPRVWKYLPTARDFLKQLKIKAGLDEDDWQDNFEITRFSATCW